MLSKVDWKQWTSERAGEQAKITYEDYLKIKAFEDVGYFLQAYVVSGGEVIKNIRRNDMVDVSDIVVSLNNDVMAREGSTFRCLTPNTEYYLDFEKSGDWHWGTAHPAGSEGVDYLTIATATSDSNRNIDTITDTRGHVGGFLLKDEYGLDNYARKAYVDEQLANKATKDELEDANSKIRSSVLYDAALKDIGVTYDLPNCKRAIKNGTLRVAIVGTSIEEGSNNLPQDVWVNRFIDKLQNDLAGVTIEYINFSLGGRNISQLLDANYKATNPETNIAINFWRDWATVGKSWKDHVKDYNADLTIFAFGMNDVAAIKSGYWFHSNLSNAITYVKPSDGSMDIALVSTILPTRNKELYDQNEQETLNLARIARELAHDNNYALIDSNRLWRIMLYGVDECNFTNKEFTSVSSINQETAYNFDASLSFVADNYPVSASACDMIFRRNETEKEYMLLRFRNDGDGNKVELYSMTEGSSGTEATLVNTFNGSKNVKIQAMGSHIIVNGTIFVFYEKLYDGSFNLSLGSYISTINLTKRVNFSDSPIYTETELLGDRTSLLNGNGINHPDSTGHYLSYYMASTPLLNSMSVRGEQVLSEFTYTDFKNTLIIEGEYSIYSASVLNPPKTGTVSGRVSVKNSGTNVWIEFRPWDNTDVYRLNYNSAVWTSWFKFSGVAV